MKKKISSNVLDSNESIENCSTLDLLKLVHRFQLHPVYPNLDISFRILLTIVATTATAEQSFNKLKIIKNYLRVTFGQERYSDLAILFIEQEISQNTDFNKVIDEFIISRSRRIPLQFRLFGIIQVNKKILL